MIKKFVVLIFTALLLFSCNTMIDRVVEGTKESDTIRVLLKLGDKVNIKLNKDIIIENALTNEIFEYKWNKRSINLDLTNDTVFLDNTPIDFTLNIYSKKNGLISINDKKYLGNIKIFPSKEIRIINYLPLETYLVSVIPAEVPLSFDIEAIKAQAIVARTYAYRFIRRNSTRYDFDVDDTTRYQVYAGYSFFMNPFIIKKLNTAVNDTKNKIVIYNDEPILAYFHSNSGGKILSGKEYFGVNSDFPYLVSKDDPFSLNYPGSSWEYQMSINDFVKSLNIINDFSNVQFIYNNDGFIDKISILNDEYYPKDIRKNIGYNLVRSERFNIELLNDDKIKFNGIGFGHGVGMSQWGAQGMAEKGFDYVQIISFYYPNTEISFIM